ncbi:zinc finger, C4 type [Ancylostoma duodenale]|uniref:Zinc finger, C4 type n=1 Tax=Ancylostoma duodenale TaxID=51022 RepID=A0A0C2GSV6_9BILA|nr:zinc finger, C4 type [Ancylostoma duodenale]
MGSDITSKREMDPARDGSNSICQICGSSAARIYYGAVACGSCKAFFVRAVKRSAPFVCDGNGKCVVNKGADVECMLEQLYKTTTGRKACKACRFMRCLQANMTEKGRVYALVTLVVKRGFYAKIKLGVK